MPITIILYLYVSNTIGLIGILVIILVSWALLFFVQKSNLLALGLLPLTRVFKLFITGFFFTALLCAMAQWTETSFSSSTWIVNTEMSTGQIIASIKWDFISVVTEELVFRGALLYILIQKIGTQKSIWISAIAFGVYHWFSYGVLGSWLPMVFVFIGTGLMGYAWAKAFARSKSILLPIGLHFGWNMTYNTIFSNGPLGKGVLLSTEAEPMSDLLSLFNFSIGLIIVPLMVLLFVRYVDWEKL